MPGWILPLALMASALATLVALAWLIAAVRRIPARFATAFDALPTRPQPMRLPRSIGRAAGALTAAMMANCTVMLAMTG